MNCQKMDLIESLQRSLKGPKGPKRVKFGCFANFLKNILITFLYFLHTASWG